MPSDESVTVSQERIRKSKSMFNDDVPIGRNRPVSHKQAVNNKGVLYKVVVYEGSFFTGEQDKHEFLVSIDNDEELNRLRKFAETRGNNSTKEGRIERIEYFPASMYLSVDSFENAVIPLYGFKDDISSHTE
jgi:hypothetical protein